MSRASPRRDGLDTSGVGSGEISHSRPICPQGSSPLLMKRAPATPWRAFLALRASMVTSRQGRRGAPLEKKGGAGVGGVRRGVGGRGGRRSVPPRLVPLHLPPGPLRPPGRATRGYERPRARAPRGDITDPQGPPGGPSPMKCHHILESSFFSEESTSTCRSRVAIQTLTTQLLASRGPPGRALRGACACSACTLGSRHTE